MGSSDVVWAARFGFNVYHALLASPYEPLTTSPRTVVSDLIVNANTVTTAEYIEDTGLALGASEDGTLWLYVSQSQNLPLVDQQGVLVSRDYGSTWEAPTTDDRCHLHPVGSVRGFNRLMAAWHGSRMVLAMRPRPAGTHADLETGSASDASVGVLYMGGYTTAEQPGDDSFGGSNAYRLMWSPTKDAYGFLALDTPDTTEWTASGAPSTSSITSDGWYRIGDATGGAFTWARTDVPSGTLSMGRASFRTSHTKSGAASGADQTIRIDSIFPPPTGGQVWGFRISASSTTLYVSEQTGASTYSVIGSVAVDVATGVEVLWATHTDGTLRLWYRTDLTAPVRRWSTLVEDAQLTDIGGGSALFRWGANLDAGDTADFREVLHLSDAEEAIEALFEQGIIDLAGRPYTSAPRGAYVEDGVALVASGGPTYPTDEWAVPLRYCYATANLLDDDPKVVSRFPWVEDTDIDIVLDLSSADTHLGSDLLGIALIGSNVGRVLISGYDLDTTTWELLGVADFGEVLGSWSKTGNGVRPNSSAAGQVVRMGEYDGAIWTSDYEGGNAAIEVETTYEGGWSTSGKRAVLHLASAEPSSTGTDGRVVPRNVVALVSLGDNAYSRLRVTLDATAYRPPDDTWEIGRLLVGPVVVHADHQAWGRVVETRPNVEVFTSKDGSRRTRRWGPPRRVVDFSWSDGVDTTRSEGDAADPDYMYVEANGDPVATLATTPWQIEGVVAMIDGAEGTVVYLPRIEFFPDEEEITTLGRRHELVYGRVVNPTRLETVQGEEGESEVIRVATVTIEEEV